MDKARATSEEEVLNQLKKFLKEIEDKIKSTMARLNSGGKNKRSKVEEINVMYIAQEK